MVLLGIKVGVCRKINGAEKDKDSFPDTCKSFTLLLNHRYLCTVYVKVFATTVQEFSGFKCGGVKNHSCQLP